MEADYGTLCETAPAQDVRGFYETGDCGVSEQPMPPQIQKVDTSILARMKQQLP
jgi:hypothetical protein